MEWQNGKTRFAGMDSGIGIGIGVGVGVGVGFGVKRWLSLLGVVVGFRSKTTIVSQHFPQRERQSDR